MVRGRRLTTSSRFRRQVGSAITRLDLHRRLHLEPREFNDLYRRHLITIEGWRYRPDLALLYLLARDVPGAGRVLEIGSYRGLSTAALASGLRAGGREGTVHAVDPHTGDRQDLAQAGVAVIPSEQQFRSNLARVGLSDRVTPHVMTSDALHSSWDGSSLRVLFIDGWHSYDAVQRDIEHWAPLVETSGVVLIDDYLNYEEVHRAVDDNAHLLPGRGRQAGRMWLASTDPLPPSIRRLLRVPWG